MKICCVIGARPQFVKAAALVRAAEGKDVDVSFIHTGQHYDENMSGVFFEEMNIPKPTVNLEVGGCNQGAMTGRMIEGLESVFEAESPDWVLVFGDTNSTIAGALTASKMQIPVAHVEAGLRSFNRKMPEEINRVLTDHCADLLLTPTDIATKNLQREGVALDKICQVGDVMVDALHYYRELANQKSNILERHGLQTKQYVLATIHRAENVTNTATLRNIFEGLIDISANIPVVLPMHPRTKQALIELGLMEKVNQMLRVIDPLGYFDMVALTEHAQVVMTDSGGLQKEAYLLEVPCVTLRHQTEWIELIEHGYNRLVPPVSAGVVKEGFESWIGKEVDWSHCLYGDGSAATRVIESLLKE